MPKPHSVTPKPQKGKKAHDQQVEFRWFNRHAWGIYDNGWTYLDPAAIITWDDLFFGRISAAFAEVIRVYQKEPEPPAKKKLYLDPWTIVAQMYPKLASARAYTKNSFFTRWWADHIIEWVGYQLWNHVWEYTFQMAKDVGQADKDASRKADKEADAYMAKFQSQFI